MANNCAFCLFTLFIVLGIIAPEVAGGASGRLSGSDAKAFVELLDGTGGTDVKYPQIKCYECTGCKDGTKLASSDLKDCKGEDKVTPVNWQAAGLDSGELREFQGCLEVMKEPEGEGWVCKTPEAFISLDIGPKYYIKPVCVMSSDAYGVTGRGCYTRYVEGAAQGIDSLAIRGECGKVKRSSEDQKSFVCYCKGDKCNSGITLRSTLIFAVLLIVPFFF